MIAVVDYGAGNLASVVNALTRVGTDATVTQDPTTILSAAGVVVPGVGAAADTMRHLDGLGLSPVIREVIARGIPYLGICMGMQALMTVSHEGGEHPGLDVIPGAVRRLPGGQPVPHMGWNQVRQVVDSPLFDGIPDLAEFYFVHSFYIDPADAAWTGGVTEYGVGFTSAVIRGNVMGTQFHPEKSGRWGLQLLANFARIVVEPTALIGSGAC
ncbi:MAG TPA: imidazole glycerol phosphate synthase subunit HisH [Thermomicrobiaceae bacterium]|nr:imidazole glycerol phosphate synthase subunit HisH [Thermomicrobiaceae bacterium]